MNRYSNIILNCKFSILTPIHIGTGEELLPIDYYVDKTERKIKKVSIESWISLMNEDKMKKFCEIITNNKELEQLKKIRKFLWNLPKENLEIEWSSNISNELINEINRIVDNPENSMKIYPTIRSNNKPIIPGSSIKGAIRTAILNKWVNKDQSIKRKWNTYKEKFNIGEDSNILEKMIIGVKKVVEKDKRSFKRSILKNSDDIFKTLIIEDIILDNKLATFTVVSREYIIGEKKKSGIPIYREVLDSIFSRILNNVEYEYNFRIILKPYLASKWLNKEITKNLIIDSLNEYYLSELKNEKNKISKFDFNNSRIKKDEIINIYESIIKEINDKSNKRKLALIRLGFGSGREFMSLKGFRKQEDTKTKNIVNYSFPLGFGMIEFEE